MLPPARTLLSRVDNSVSEGIGKSVLALASHSESVFAPLRFANRHSAIAIIVCEGCEVNRTEDNPSETIFAWVRTAVPATYICKY